MEEFFVKGTDKLMVIITCLVGKWTEEDRAYDAWDHSHLRGEDPSDMEKYKITTYWSFKDAKKYLESDNQRRFLYETFYPLAKQKWEPFDTFGVVAEKEKIKDFYFDYRLKRIEERLGMSDE